MEDGNLTTNYEFLDAFCSNVLALDKSIRWAGIVSRLGVILSQKKREGLQPLLSEEENEEYAATAISRQKTRSKFASKMGRLVYAFGKYEKLNRTTIPINENYFLLISLDVGTKNFDEIISEKIVPLIENQKDRFVE
jgi:hypothetical protein